MNHNNNNNITAKGSVFDNPYFKQAFESLTPIEREKYRKMGENIYGKINFEQSKILDEVPPPVEESIAYIEAALRSGLLPKDLTDNEISFMENEKGKEWYKKYGFNQQDLIKN